jgi:hypothetical protein
MREARIWKVRAADLRLMAGRAWDVERQRKLLVLADQFEQSARTGEASDADGGDSPDARATHD